MNREQALQEAGNAQEIRYAMRVPLTIPAPHTIHESGHCYVCGDITISEDKNRVEGYSSSGQRWAIHMCARCYVGIQDGVQGAREQRMREQAREAAEYADK